MGTVPVPRSHDRVVPRGSHPRETALTGFSARLGRSRRSRRAVPKWGRLDHTGPGTRPALWLYGAQTLDLSEVSGLAGVKGWLSRALMAPSVHQSPFNPTLQHDQSVERHISFRHWALLHPPADHMAAKPLKSDPEGDIVRASKDRVSGHPRSAFLSGRTPRLTAMSERMKNVRGPE